MKRPAYSFQIQHSAEIRILESADICWFKGDKVNSYRLMRIKPDGGYVDEETIRTPYFEDQSIATAAMVEALNRRFRQKISLVAC